MWIDSIDKIFLINTEDEIGWNRLPIAFAELDKHNIPAIRYKAIKNEKNGAVGLSQTMRILFEENKGNHILVFEDDILILNQNVNDFDEYMEAAMWELPPDYHCLYLGCNLLLPPARVSDTLLKVRAAYSSHAVIYSKKCIDLMLTLWEEKPFDMFLMQKIQPYGKSFCTFPMLISQRKGVSNIFEYNPQEQVGLEKYYDVKTQEIDWGLFMERQFELMTKNL